MLSWEVMDRFRYETLISLFYLIIFLKDGKLSHVHRAWRSYSLSLCLEAEVGIFY